MKKSFHYAFVTALMMVMTVGLAHAQKRGDDSKQKSKNAESTGMIGETKVRVTYGAPHVKGRTVFGGLEKWGKVWRAGANEATTVTFSADVKVNGEDLAAGTYAYFIRPNEEGAWEVIFNTVPNQWGAFDHDSDKDALVVMAEPEEADHQEIMSIEVVSGDSEGQIVMHWATTKLPVTVTS